MLALVGLVSGPAQVTNQLASPSDPTDEAMRPLRTIVPARAHQVLEARVEPSATSTAFGTVVSETEQDEEPPGTVASKRAAPPRRGPPAA